MFSGSLSKKSCLEGSMEGGHPSRASISSISANGLESPSGQMCRRHDVCSCKWIQNVSKRHSLSNVYLSLWGGFLAIRSRRNSAVAWSKATRTWKLFVSSSDIRNVELCLSLSKPEVWL